jgi:acyl-CoA thioester hydrolase
MTPRFTRLFRVRHYELDAFGHVSRVNLVRYMQEAAIEASTALGFSLDWYSERSLGWVVRRLTVRYLGTADYGDEIAADTWLSGLRGVRSIREYDLRRSREGSRMARGRAEWVYMDFQTGEPTRVPDEWAQAFALKGKPEDLGVRLNEPRPTEGAFRYVSRRRVQFHELDTVQHVNHAVYLHWVEQAYLDALRSLGYPSERELPDGDRVLLGGHEIQYFAAALDNENIEIVSWLCETADTGAAWTHEIYNADTHKLLARDYSLHLFVNARNEPIPPPAQLIETALQGPVGSQG